MADIDWRVEIIDFITDEKLPIDKNKAITIARRSKGYVLVGDKLYKKRFPFRCAHEVHPLRGGKEHTCGNHATSRTLVGKAFRAGFYWPTTPKDSEILVK